MGQQTAVDWIVDQMLSEGHKEMWKDMIQQAKQMEKEQMHKVASFWRGKENEIEKPIFQQYYNETFKN